MFARLAAPALAAVVCTVASAEATAHRFAGNPSVLIIQNANGHLRHSPELMRDLHEEGFDIQFIQSWNDAKRDRKFGSITTGSSRYRAGLPRSHTQGNSPE